MRRLFSVIVFAAVCLHVQAQDIMSLCNNPLYITGTGMSDTSALSSMYEHVADAYQGTLDRRLVASYHDELRGISHRMVENGVACRYVSRAEVESVFAARKSQADQMVAQAMASSGDKGRAAMYFYWAIAYYESLPGDNSSQITLAREKYLSLSDSKFPTTAASNIAQKVEFIYSMTGRPQKPLPKVDRNPPVRETETVPAAADTARGVEALLSIPDSIPVPAAHASMEFGHANVIGNFAGNATEPSGSATKPSCRATHSTFITAGCCICSNPGVRVMAGSIWKNTLGFYVSASDNFRHLSYDYTIGPDQSLEDGGYFWGDGSGAASYRSVTAGIAYTPLPHHHLGVYAGCGYASFKTVLHDIDGDSALDSGRTSAGLQADAGIAFSLGHFMATAGLECSRHNVVTAVTAGIIF